MQPILAQLWPTDVVGWVGLALSIGGVIGAAVALGWRVTTRAIADAMDKQDRNRDAIKKDLTVLTDRVSAGEESVRKNRTEINSQRDRIVEVEHRQQILERDLSRMIGELTQLTASVDRAVLQITSAERAIEPRLVRIEENLKVANAIQSMGEHLASTGSEIASAIMSDVRDRERSRRLKGGES